MMSSPVVGTMPPPPPTNAHLPSPIVPAVSSAETSTVSLTRASTSSPVAPMPPPPSTSTSVCSEYAPSSPITAASSEAAPLFGTKIPLTPENMAVPDPALLAGMPPPTVLANFGNLSINNGGMPAPPPQVGGMPIPPVAPLASIPASENGPPPTTESTTTPATTMSSGPPAASTS